VLSYLSQEPSLRLHVAFLHKLALWRRSVADLERRSALCNCCAKGALHYAFLIHQPSMYSASLSLQPPSTPISKDYLTSCSARQGTFKKKDQSEEWQGQENRGHQQIFLFSSTDACQFSFPWIHVSHMGISLLLCQYRHFSAPSGIERSWQIYNEDQSTRPGCPRRARAGFYYALPRHRHRTVPIQVTSG
jgi:hypothetical protein